MTKTVSHKNFKSMWTYNGKPFGAEDVPEDAVGFVYRITNKADGKKYVGKKNFWKVVVRPPLKGQKRKRRTKVQSDWLIYTSSSDKLKADIADKGLSGFSREILEICYSKGMLSYTEAKMQFDLGVLFDDSYINGIIQCRINKSHLKPPK